MYRPVPLIALACLLALLVGWGGGNYLAWARANVALSSLPAAPVVTDAEYDHEQRLLTLTLTNPGLVPIELLNKTLMLRPASGEDNVALLDVAFPGGSLRLPPASIERLELRLAADDPKLAAGDVLASSITYRYADIPDVYQITHALVAERGDEETAPDGNPANDKADSGADSETDSGKENAR